MERNTNKKLQEKSMCKGKENEKKKKKRTAK